MSELVSKCVLRVEVGDPQETSTEAKNGAAEASGGERKTTKKSRGQRKSRDICVETFPSRLESPREDWGLLPASSREATPMSTTEKEAQADEKGEIGFFSGNPFVEITKGILHLYKEDVLSDRKEALTLCLLGVPNSMTCHDLLAFTAPCHADIAHFRVLRDSLPNQYMALLTFRTHESAIEFYVTFNGGPYNGLEPDNICRIVWVSRVEWAMDGQPPPGHTELPVCPVCLERMDESVDGVLTILCNHAFHADCLEQWGDSTCPVCRCVQSPEQAATSECEQCERHQETSGGGGGTGGGLGVREDAEADNNDATDTLWICLICGHVGCGRYQGGHAFMHYRESGHCYALQLGSHRVWDYKGDNFVHRLLQNKADGKLVAAEGPPSEAECAREKVDSVQLEFTYLLTSQLEEQRMYFEEKLAQTESLLYDEIQTLQTDLQQIIKENRDLKIKLSATTKEKTALERKLTQQNAKLSASLNELNEEKQLGKALRNNQQQWQDKLNKLEKDKEESDKKIAELNEQVRDLMFFINGRDAVAQSGDKEDIAGGTIIVGESSSSSGKKSKKGKKSKR